MNKDFECDDLSCNHEHLDPESNCYDEAMAKRYEEKEAKERKEEKAEEAREERKAKARRRRRYLANRLNALDKIFGRFI